MPLTEAERKLLKRAVRRDPHAFSDLYVLYQRAVFLEIYSLVKNSHDADDLTSETFLRAWNAIERFEDRGYTVEAWLQRIGRNLSISYLRRRGRESNDGGLDLQIDPDMLPEQRAEASLENETVRQALTALPTIQRQVLTLRFFENLSYEQVSSIVGKPQGTVRVIQHRGLRSLRNLLARSSILGRGVRNPNVAQPAAIAPGTQGGGD